MDVVILSEKGASLDLAVRLKASGHEVALWIKHKNFAHVGGGMVNVIPVWEPTKADLYILDSIELTDLEPKLANRGANYISLLAARQLMQDPSERWSRLTSVNLPMPPVSLTYLSDVNNPPSEPSLVHFVRPHHSPRVVAPGDWPKVKQTMPADQEIAVVMIPEGPKFEAIGLVHKGGFVEGSGVLSIGRDGWTFAIPATSGVLEFLRMLAKKMPPTYAGPLAIQMVLTDLGWVVLEFAAKFVWELMPLLMRSIKEDALFVLSRLTKGNIFSVTSNNRMVFLQPIVAPESFDSEKRGMVLPNLQQKLPGIYHPMNVFRAEGFYKFAGTSRFIGSWSFVGSTVEDTMRHAALSPRARESVELTIANRLQQLPASEARN